MKRRPPVNSLSALALVEALVIITTLMVLAACLLPALVKTRPKSKRIHCDNNLRQIGLAFRVWPNDSNDAYQMRRSITDGGTMEWVAGGEVWPHFLVMSNELNTPKILVCPADTSRITTASFDKLSNSNISYFVGLDAAETEPHMLLSGDSNLEVDGKPVGPGLLNLWTNSTVGWTATRHVRHGNVALADGSVQQYGNARLQHALVTTGAATNRFLVP